MFYVSLPAGKLANRTGRGLPDCGGVPHFCGQETQSLTFAFVAPDGELPPDFFTGDFFLSGAVEYNSKTPCFYAAGVVDAAAQTVTFAVDTYTEQYLHNVTRPWMTMYCDITRRSPGEGNDVRLCNFPAPADPRVYIPGLPPAPVESYYTRVEVNQLLVPTVKHAEIMPAPSAALAGAVYVYTGVDGEYKQGLLYVCTGRASVYSWQEYTVLQGPPGPQGVPGPASTTEVELLTDSEVVIESCRARTWYSCGEITSLTVETLGNGYDDSTITFTAGEGFTASFPATVLWLVEVSFTAGKQYMVIFCGYYAAAAEVA